MFYTQKEMCQAFHITRNTLRHYEALGIITPRIDEKNGYRSYGYEEVRALHDCKAYQAMGLSLAEAKDLIHCGSLAEQARCYSERAQAVLQRARLEMMAAEHLAAFADRIKEAEGRLGTFYTLRSEDVVYVGVESNDEMVYGDEAGDAVRNFMRDHFEVCALAFKVKNMTTNGFEWGYAMKGTYYVELKGPDCPPYGGALREFLATTVAVADEGSLDCGVFSGLFAEAERQNLAVEGDVFGFLLARAQDESGRRVRYLEAMVPVRTR